MYLSEIRIDGLNRATRHLIDDPYKLHAALMGGFAPDQPGERVLFRQEPPQPGSAWAQVIVQSQTEPNWTALLEKYADHLRLRTKTVALAFQPGQLLRFRLRANPTVARKRLDGAADHDNRCRKPRRGEAEHASLDDAADHSKHRSQRCGLVGESDQRKWLQHRSASFGFALRYFQVVDEGMVSSYKRAKETTKEQQMSFRTVRYEGVLVVEDAARLHETITKGIGPAKGFGCGLLSVAPG